MFLKFVKNWMSIEDVAQGIRLWINLSYTIPTMVII
jgi:hypothetical protein